MKKRIIWWIELASAVIYSIQIFLAINSGYFESFLPVLIIELNVYLIISLVFYFALDKKWFSSELKLKIDSPKDDITEDQRNKFISRALVQINITKFLIVLMIASYFILGIFEFAVYYYIAVLLILFSAMLYLVVLFSKNVANSKGYAKISKKELMTKYLFYYNKEDKRTILEKPFGVGSTINLASKDGKIILGVILAIPITIILLILIVVLLSK